jgi:hypothetical protein
VFHVSGNDNTGEFDPFFIERIKNCLHLMTEKEFIQQLDQEISMQHTYKNAEIAVRLDNQVIEHIN